MVVLDATIVTIALPSAQKALGFSTESRQWIVTAYALAFGSLLLLGGKLGDLFGRKWTLIAGLVGSSPARSRVRSAPCLRPRRCRCGRWRSRDLPTAQPRSGSSVRSPAAAPRSAGYSAVR
jgi:hypothetical protein